MHIRGEAMGQADRLEQTGSKGMVHVSDDFLQILSGVEYSKGLTLANRQHACFSGTRHTISDFASIDVSAGGGGRARDKHLEMQRERERERLIERWVSKCVVEILPTWDVVEMKLEDCEIGGTNTNTHTDTHLGHRSRSWLLQRQ